MDGGPKVPQACFTAEHFVLINHSPVEHENKRRCALFSGLDLNFLII